MHPMIRNLQYRHYVEVAAALRSLGYTDAQIEHFYFDGVPMLNIIAVWIDDFYTDAGDHFVAQRIGAYSFDKHQFYSVKDKVDELSEAINGGIYEERTT